MMDGEKLSTTGKSAYKNSQISKDYVLLNLSFFLNFNFHD
jgi:hypothetical protein